MLYVMETGYLFTFFSCQIHTDIMILKTFDFAYLEYFTEHWPLILLQTKIKPRIKDVQILKQITYVDLDQNCMKSTFRKQFGSIIQKPFLVIFRENLLRFNPGFAEIKGVCPN